jgi:large subunit ribosomal protein L23
MNSQGTSLIDTIKYPIVTEKGIRLLEENQYMFAVDKSSTKDSIKAAIEEIFDVKVSSVNTCKSPRRKRRLGRFVGNRPSYKKAIVTLSSGDLIKLFEDT